MIERNKKKSSSGFWFVLIAPPEEYGGTIEDDKEEEENDDSPYHEKFYETSRWQTEKLARQFAETVVRENPGIVVVVVKAVVEMKSVVSIATMEIGQ